MESLEFAVALRVPWVPSLLGALFTTGQDFPQGPGLGPSRPIPGALARGFALSVTKDFEEFVRPWQTTHVFCSPRQTEAVPFPVERHLVRPGPQPRWHRRGRPRPLENRAKPRRPTALSSPSISPQIPAAHFPSICRTGSQASPGGFAANSRHRASIWRRQASSSPSRAHSAKHSPASRNSRPR